MAPEQPKFVDHRNKGGFFDNAFGFFMNVRERISDKLDEMNAEEKALDEKPIDLEVFW